MKYSIIITSLLTILIHVNLGFAWQADNENGTFTNPLFYDEFSDPDLIRVGDDFYLTGTTMHSMPGLPILHSNDLVNWELLTYAFEQLDLGPAFRLENGQSAYGQGIWAPCFRFHDGTFYIFSNVNGHNTQVFTAADPAGPWEHKQMKKAFHDLSVLFDDDGKAYIIWGYQGIRFAQLNDALDDIVPGTEKIIIERDAGMGEGVHFYKIDGKYFITSAWFVGRMRMPCARADQPEGPYEVNQAISIDEDFGLAEGFRLGNSRDSFDVIPQNTRDGGRMSMHQGGIVSTQTGEWWGFSMMDYNSVGRLTCLSPVTWKDGWPYFGLPGNLKRTPRTWVKPNTGFTSKPKIPYQRNDDFSGPELANVWQWNHVPVDEKWSLEERKGYLRLHSLPAASLWDAKNTLTQRSIGPVSYPITELDLSGMKTGDVAGLALMNYPYGWIGVTRYDEGYAIEQYDQLTDELAAVGLNQEQVWLKAECDFLTEKARFFYSLDGEMFEPLGKEFRMIFQLRTFQGVRYSLFHYNTKRALGGYVDFNEFTVEEPHPHGLMKPIPYGKEIMIAVRGTESLLGVNEGELSTQKNSSSNKYTKFKVIDCGLGRVALKSSNGMITVDKPGRVSLSNDEITDAEKFQWMENVYGDLILMSLKTNCFLRVNPDTGVITADHPGPKPNRMDGSCFVWDTDVPVIAAAPQFPKTTIRVTDEKKEISPDLYGIFFEDLNYAADGGLYAELIQNRSFEFQSTEQISWNNFTYWEEVKSDNSNGNIVIDAGVPIHENNPNYVVLHVPTAGDGYGLMNPGFDGIPLKKGETYDISFFAKQLYMNYRWGSDNSIKGRPMLVLVQLQNEDGEVLGESSISVEGRDWAKYSSTIQANGTDPKARFVILAKKDGGIALDMISLFPQETFHQRKNGLRKDLAQTIADLEPKFVRFPGGCLVHGNGLSNMYDWKDTVGSVEERKGQMNLWGYHQSVGLGYFEYFQYCEDIGAIPLPVVPAAVTCQHTGQTNYTGQQCLPMEDMDEYIQDVLDLIEWANGPADSEWGAVRAAAGHPEPFGLKYLGVGNEDVISPGFEERFTMIYEAVKEKHPEIVVVGTAGPFPDGEDYDLGWELANELGLTLVDEHCYKPPQWYWDHLDRFDRYDRSKAKVYLGEFAAHDDRRLTTLRSALAEAAYMTSMERNGDIVQFSSYAPLLGKRGRTQWNPDLIYFSNTEIHPTINYYVQKMFSNNNGDVYYETKVDDRVDGKKVAVSTVQDHESGDVIVKIVNSEDEDILFDVNLLPILPSNKIMNSTIWVLDGEPMDVNRFGDSDPLVPITRSKHLSSQFEIESPAHSLKVIRIQTNE